MSYDLSFNSTFLTDFAAAPKNVQNSFRKTVENYLRSSATLVSGNIKKLKGFSNLWRFRISDNYRIIYQVDGNQVTLMMVGNRKDVYKRLNYDPDKESPNKECIALIPDIVEPKPSPQQIGMARIEIGHEKDYSVRQYSPLPKMLTGQNLADWGIDKKYHSVFTGCKTEDDLLGAGVPVQIIEKVLNILYPSSITTVINSPKFTLVRTDDLEDVMTGKKDLTSFLLKLDNTQRKFLQKFERQALYEGPWIIKGGPGSGKSTMALYSIVSLLSNKLPFSNHKDSRILRVLFTTYTNSLVNSSRQLLKQILGDTYTKNIHVRTMNSLASFIAHPKERGYKFLKDEKQHRQIMNTAIQDARSKNKLKSLANKDNIFIEEEIEWIILGNNLKTVEDYKKAKRAGRGRRLGSSQREELWVVYESYRSQLRSQRYTTHDIVVCEAYDKVRTLPHDKKYDFVFIDEAQDFKPVGLRLCIALCKDPKNVYLTADINQGIYGHDISWTSIDGTLKSAKKEELEQNYRFTKEISEAIRLISLKIQVKDKDTLNSNCVYRGNPPTIKYYKDSEDELQSITEFIIRNAHDLNVGLGCAAILCRSNRDAEELTKKLPPKLKAKYMHSNEVDIEYNGVKVITMHAAKGLQFPIVVVARINKGVFPIPAHGGQAEEEHFDMEWKLFFVACSRAMRSLLVTTNKQKPSLFLEGLTDDYWEIIGK